MCFNANAFTHTMTSYMRKKREEQNGGGGGRKRNKYDVDEHRWQRKRIVVRRKRKSYIAGRKHLHFTAGRRRWGLKRGRKIIEGWKIDRRAGRRRRFCTRRIDGEGAWALNTRRHGLGHRNFIAEVIDEWEKERWNTHNGILNNLGGKGLDTHYGMALKSA